MSLIERNWAVMYVVSMALRIDQVTLHHLILKTRLLGSTRMLRILANVM